MVTIHVIKMTHASGEMLEAYRETGVSSDIVEPVDFEGRARSQHHSLRIVLDLLSQNPNMPILYDNLPCQVGSKQLTESINDLFPDGLPQQFEDLTSGQKEYLTNYGLPGFLLGTGKISRLFPDSMQVYSSSADSLNVFSGRGDKAVQREYMALNRALWAASSQGLNEAIVIYGRGHDFDMEKCFHGKVKLKIHETEGLLDHPYWQGAAVSFRAHHQTLIEGKEKCLTLKRNGRLLDKVAPERDVTCDNALLFVPVEPALKPKYINDANFFAAQPETFQRQNTPNEMDGYIIGGTALVACGVLAYGFGLFKRCFGKQEQTEKSEEKIPKNQYMSKQKRN